MRGFGWESKKFFDDWCKTYVDEDHDRDCDVDARLRLANWARGVNPRTALYCLLNLEQCPTSGEEKRRWDTAEAWLAALPETMTDYEFEESYGQLKL